MGQSQLKTTRKVQNMNNSYTAGFGVTSKLDQACQSVNIESSGEDSSIEKINRLCVPVSCMKTVNLSAGRDRSVKKSTYGKKIGRMSSRSMNEIDSKRKPPASANKIRLDHSTTRVEKKIGDDALSSNLSSKLSVLSKRNDNPAYLDFSEHSTKVSATYSPMSRGGTSSWKNSNQHGFESDEEGFPDIKNIKISTAELMQNRLLEILKAKLPEVDLDDYEALKKVNSSSRQFAPEYSQWCYNDMMENQNDVIGNYLANPNKLTISTKDRDKMIQTIQMLHKKKDGYKQETMHLAGNIADRYLAFLARKGK